MRSLFGHHQSLSHWCSWLVVANLHLCLHRSIPTENCSRIQILDLTLGAFLYKCWRSILSTLDPSNGRLGKRFARLNATRLWHFLARVLLVWHSAKELHWTKWPIQGNPVHHQQCAMTLDSQSLCYFQCHKPHQMVACNCHSSIE